jgi:hypothetical protein
MISRWASGGLSGPANVFKTLQAGLTVDLITTPVADLKTCEHHELISDVIERSYRRKLVTAGIGKAAYRGGA